MPARQEIEAVGWHGVLAWDSVVCVARAIVAGVVAWDGIERVGWHSVLAWDPVAARVQMMWTGSSDDAALPVGTPCDRFRAFCAGGISWRRKMPLVGLLEDRTCDVGVMTHTLQRPRSPTVGLKLLLMCTPIETCHSAQGCGVAQHMMCAFMGKHEHTRHGPVAHHAWIDVNVLGSRFVCSSAGNLRIWTHNDRQTAKLGVTREHLCLCGAAEHPKHDDRRDDAACGSCF